MEPLPIQTLNHEHRLSTEISSTLLLVGLVNLIFYIYVLAVPFSRQYSNINKAFIADIFAKHVICIDWFLHCVF